MAEYLHGEQAHDNDYLNLLRLKMSGMFKSALTIIFLGNYHRFD